MEGQTLAEIMLGRKPEAGLKFLRMENHENTLSEALASMFVRRGYPAELDGLRRAEEWLLQYGAIAYVRVDKGDKLNNIEDVTHSEYRCCICYFGGERYPEGIGSIAIVRTPDGYCEEFNDWKTNKNIVVAFNNQTFTPDLNIGFTAAKLAEYDISIDYQIHYSRLYPIPLVHDDKTRAAIQEALDNMRVGKYTTILSTNILDEMIRRDSGSGNVVEMLQLSDPKASDHIQYLDHGRDDVLRWFWMLYGMRMDATSKMAQQTVAETQNGDALSMIIPHARYHQRQQEVADLKSKFEWDVSIEFAEPWQSSFANCSEEVTESEEDITNRFSEEHKPNVELDKDTDADSGTADSAG